MHQAEVRQGLNLLSPVVLLKMGALHKEDIRSIDIQTELDDIGQVLAYRLSLKPSIAREVLLLKCR
jgi:hypothetical protein